MIDFGVTIGSLDLIPCLPSNVGFKLWPKTFAHFDYACESVKKLPSQFLVNGAYQGCSALFNAWSDDEVLTEAKLARFEKAIALHFALCDLSGEDVPFALVTEPIGVGRGSYKAGKFGVWTNTDRAGERIAKVCLNSGLTWVSISQNRITSDEIAAKTIAMAEAIQCHGVEVTVGWQCWPGWGSTECISLVQRRIAECAAVGISGTLAEIGFRYSRFVNQTREGLAMAKIESDYCLGRTADWIDSQLDASDILATWWQGDMGKTPDSNLILPRTQIAGIDLKLLLELDCQGSSLGSDCGGVKV